MLPPTAKLTRRTASRRTRWRTTWEKRRTTRTARVTRRTTKTTTSMGPRGREWLRTMMMMMKRTKLKPRSRRQTSSLAKPTLSGRRRHLEDRQPVFQQTFNTSVLPS